MIDNLVRIVCLNLIFLSVNAQSVTVKKIIIVTKDYWNNSNPIPDTSTIVSNKDYSPDYSLDNYNYRLARWKFDFFNRIDWPIRYSVDRQGNNITHLKSDTCESNRIFNIIQIKFYYDILNEWFVHKRIIKKSKHKIISCLTFYHEYHKKYFTTKTISRYDRNGLLKTRRTYDLYLKQIEKEENYYYVH